MIWSGMWIQPRRKVCICHTWPEYDPGLINMDLIRDMRVAERLVSLGRAARENANLRVRQPLASAQFATREDSEAEAVRKLSGIIQSELNVKSVKVLEGAGDVVAYVLNPLPSLLGKKFGKDFPVVQKVLREGAQEDVHSLGQRPDQRRQRNG